MFKLRSVFYTCFLLCAALLPMSGCGKPEPPPAGTKENITAPSIDLGNESAPKDAGAKSLPSDGGAPPSDSADPK